MALTKGYTGKVLRVDLTKKRVSTEPLREDAAKSFIGGRGLGAKYLFDEVPAGTDPLGEKNKMVFLTGPLVQHSFTGKLTLDGGNQITAYRNNCALYRRC